MVAESELSLEVSPWRIDLEAEFEDACAEDPGLLILGPARLSRE